MRANAHTDKKFRLDGPHLVASISRCQFIRIAHGLRVGQLGFDFFQGVELLGCASDDPHWLASPFHGEFFSGFDGGNIYLNRGSGGFGALGRTECADEGDSNRCSPSNTCATSGDEPSAFTGVYSGVTMKFRGLT